MNTTIISILVLILSGISFVYYQNRSQNTTEIISNEEILKEIKKPETGPRLTESGTIRKGTSKQFPGGVQVTVSKDGKVSIQRPSK